MKPILRMSCFAAAAALCSVLVSPPVKEAAAASGENFVTIGTGGITGVYYPVGGAICRLVNKDRKTHGVRCNVESTGASVFNANAIRAGDLTMGVVQSDIQFYAYKGTDRFASAGPDEKMRVLFGLYPEAFTVVARDDSNIATFDDLKGKRVNIGDPGSGNRGTMELVMQEYGWNEKTFALATDLKASEMAGALCDNKIDAFVYVIGHPNGSIKEATTTCKSHVVPVTGPKIDAFVKKYPFYPMAAIPGEVYANNPEPVQTFGPRATIVASTDMTDDQAYIVTKAVFENLDEFKKLHPALENLTPEEMLKGNTAPFHPGAVRYYKEKGLMR